MVALGDDGEPVFDALLWNDVRSADQARRLRAHWGPEVWAREVGVVPVASFTVTKLAWLAEQRPDIAERVDRVMLPHDWLTWRLTGRPEEAVTDRSDASGTGYYSVPEDRYREDILTEAFGRVPRLPRVLGPTEVAGETASGAVVAAGCGDNAGAALGLDLRPGDVAVSIGTSGTVFASSAQPVHDPSGTVAGFADATGRHLPLAATINAARVLSTTAGLLGVDLDELDRLAQSGPPDGGGLTFVPYLEGERTPDLPDASGSLVGLTRANLTPENLARAAVLGMLLHAGRRTGPVHRVGRPGPPGHPDRRRLRVHGRPAGRGRPVRRTGRHPATGRVRRPGRGPPGGVGGLGRRRTSALAALDARHPRASWRRLGRRGAGPFRRRAPAPVRRVTSGTASGEPGTVGAENRA